MTAPPVARTSWIARSARLAMVAAVSLALSVCGETPTGLRTDADGLARLAFQPELRPADRPLFQNANVGIDKVYLVIRASDGTIVFERVVDFPAGQDAVEIVADVPVRGESERFTAQFELRNGTTPIFRGTQEVVAKPGKNAPTQTTVALNFVGPGATAVSVAVTPSTSTLLAGALTTLTANASDAAGAVIVNALFSWSSSDPTIATVSPTGSVTAGARRGTATITASTLSGISGSANVTVTLPAARVVVESPAILTGRVGSTLATPFTVRVVASDDVPVPGTVVTFAALANGAQVGSATATTDAAGRASTTMTLGGALNAQLFRATVTGLPPVTLSVDATVGLPDAIAAVNAPPSSETIGRALPQPFTVRVTDRFGNPVPNVPVAWVRILGNGTLGATTSTTDGDGRTQIGYTLGNVPGAESVRATITTASGTATATFNTTAVALPASRIVIVSGDRQSGSVGTPAEQPLVVRVTDALNNNISGATVEWTVGGAATLSASSTQTGADGTAQLTPTYTNRPGGVTVRAALGSVSVAFTLTASVGDPAKIVFLAGAGQSVSVSSAVAVAPSVLVTDRFDNPTPGVSVVFTAGSGGAVTGSPAVTNSSGVATLGSWTLGGAAGAQSLTATAGSASTSISATATAPVGPPVLAMATQPSATVQNTALLAQQPAVQLKNAAGGNLNLAGVVVSVASTVPFNPILDGQASVVSGAAVRGILTATTNASGVATFTNLSLLGPVGSVTLDFTAAGYTGVTSAAISLTAGPAVYLTATTATTLTGVVGAVATPNPQVIAKDSAQNPVSGVTVTFAPLSAGHGTVVTGAGSVTNASGHASPTSWTYDAVAGTDVLTATAAGLVGSPVSFTATTTAGAATQLVIVSGNNQTGVTGNPLASPMVVEARDALNNPVSGVSIAFTTLTGGGTPATASATTSGTGQASFTLTLGAPGGQSVQACLPSCATAQVTFAATSIPVGANAIWNGTASGNWSNAANWSPAVVPTGSSNVFIPSGTPNVPTLISAMGVNHLTLASGATFSLSGFNLTVGGDLLATGATMASSGGTLYFCGGTHSVAGGTGPITTDCGATVAAIGTLTINGSLSTNSSSVFDVGSADVTVSGAVSMLSGSRIKMTNASGKLTVLGTYTSDPNNDVGDTFMTDGVLELKGDLLATSSCCSQSFRAVGNHLTRFSGSAAQTVNFYYAENYSRSTFGRVEFTGGNTVTLTNDMRAWGSIAVTNNTTVTGSGRTIFHVGTITTTAGTNLAGLASTQQQGGGTFPVFGGTPPGTIELNGSFTVTLPTASLIVPGNLAVYGGAVLDLQGNSLTVAGNFGMYSGSRVKMTNAAAYFRVNGTYDSNPNNDVGDTFMTDGVLELKGNLLATSSCCSQSFRAVGNHLTRFSGSAAQTINFYYAENYSRSTFGRVEFTGGNTVTLSNDLRAWSTVVVNNNTVVTGSGRTIFHIGSLTTTAGTNLAGLASTQQQGGGTFPVFGGTPPGTIELNGAFTATLPSASLTVPGNLALHGGAVLDLQGNSLTVAGNFGMYSGSRVKMTNAAAYFRVDGTYDSNPNNDVGDTFMTDGVLELKGNLLATSSCCSQSFRAVGNHLTRFSGSAAQTINFYYADNYSRSTFGRVEFTGGNTVTLSNDLRAWSTVVVNNNTVVTGSGRTIFHIGALSTTAGTSLAGLASTQLQGAGTMPLFGGTPPGTIEINGAFTTTLPTASVNVPGNLALYGGAVLDLQGNSLTVAGNFGMYSGSRVKMTNAAAYFRVDGTYDSNPNNDVGDTFMTDGVLELKGNLLATSSCCSQSFRAVGNHLTRFSGSAAQTINFYYADNYSRSTFGRVEFTGGNTVTLSNDLRAWSTVVVNNNTVVTGSGRTIFHIGSLTTTAGTNLAGLASTQQQGGGTFPQIAGTAPGTVELNGSFTATLPTSTLTLPTNLALYGGSVLDIGANNLTITGNLTLTNGSGSRLKMNNAAGVLTVYGNASFSALDAGAGDLTAGVFELRGNFSAGTYGQAFLATGSHVMRFAGTGAQSVFLQYTGGGQSQFASIEITNASTAGVTPTSNIPVGGNLTQLGRLSITSVAVNVAGAVALGPSSNTSVVGGALNKASCSIISGTPVFSGFSCP